MNAPPDTTAPPRLRLFRKEAPARDDLGAGVLESVCDAEREIDAFLAGDDGPVGNVQRQRLLRMRETISTAHSLIDLERWKRRAEAGRVTPVPVDLRFPLRDTLENRAPFLRGRRIRLEWEMPRRRVAVAGDPELLAAVIDFVLAELVRGAAPRSVITARLTRQESRFALRLEVRGRILPRWRFRRAGALLADAVLRPLGGEFALVPGSAAAEIRIPPAIG